MVRKTYESERSSQTLLLAVGFVSGSLLLLFSYWTTFGVEAWWQTETFPAFILGLVIVGVSTVGLLARSKRTVVIDSQLRLITITDQYFGKRKDAKIDFADVESVRLSQFGLTLGERRFDVILECKNGKSVQVFFPAYFRGTFVRSEVAQYKEEIERLIFGI